MKSSLYDHSKNSSDEECIPDTNNDSNDAEEKEYKAGRSGG